MNSNLGKANEPLSEVKTGKQAFISPGDIADAFNTRFTNIGQSLAQEIPSLEIDPLAYVNNVDGVFSFQRINAPYLWNAFPSVRFICLAPGRQTTS